MPDPADAALKLALERLYTEAIATPEPFDPVGIVRTYRSQADQEVVGLIASLLAYGRIGQILVSTRKVLDALSGRPARALQKMRFEELIAALQGFRHRFTGPAAMALLLHGTGRTLQRHGSLQEAFAIGHRSAQTTGDALSRFVQLVRDHALQGLPRGGGPRGSGPCTARDLAEFRHLLSSPADKSACKRLNLYLRWMARPDDGIDLGLWKEVSPARLIVPLDTHTARVARRLGLLKRRSDDWKAAVELTEALKRLDPADPVKYDFALSHLGSEGPCKNKLSGEGCAGCELLGSCLEPRAGGQRRN